MLLKLFLFGFLTTDGLIRKLARTMWMFLIMQFYKTGDRYRVNLLASIETECFLVFYHLWVSTERKWSFTESLRCFYIMMMENILWCTRILKLGFLVIPHALFVLLSFRSNHIDMRRLERELYEVNLLRKQAIDDQEYVYRCAISLRPLHASQRKSPCSSHEETVFTCALVFCLLYFPWEK